MTPTSSLPPGFLHRPFAHRGLHGHGRPENSRSAILAAVEADYGIEIDLQPAVDGTPMVFHDATLDRLTQSTGAIAQRSAAELGSLKLTGCDDTIPRLEEVLALVAGRVPILIELKDQSGALVSGPPTLEPATAELLRVYQGPAAVMSFNPHMIASIAKLAPEIPRGLVTCAFDPDHWPDLASENARALGQISTADTLRIAFISHEHHDLSARAVAVQRRAGRAILCWTIKSPEAERAALYHADAITFEGYLPEAAVKA
ncbi:MAG: glycerophosphodiester phosphodiesterase family protein [Pseudomonadota bacterium]